MFGLGSAGLSVVGVSVERFAVATAQGGEVGLGAWAAVMGAVALYFAYYVAADKVVPAWSELKRAAGGASARTE
ncbi:hypothetical protein [Halobellus sp. EA9]|uniref:hypothetical protein n=1 Tax=Halobellus sp. EA9 TaxID=3421647 RepID=UPI003EB707A9